MLTAELLYTFCSATAYLLQRYCKAVAVLLQIYVQCYCKPFAAPLQKACSVFAVGSVCVSIVNGVIRQSVSLRLQVDIRRAAETDDVADTVSYADVHTAVKAEMDIPSKLLEHVCGRIINRLFHDFPQIEEITLKLAKKRKRQK